MTSELVTGMLAVVEESDREEGEIRLVTELFPPFADLFKQIRAADKAFAVQCMQHYISWLQGPPNRPTEDEVGLVLSKETPLTVVFTRVVRAKPLLPPVCSICNSRVSAWDGSLRTCSRCNAYTSAFF